MASRLVPIILSGGSGTRLWPLSRQGYPKQFLQLLGEQSLFQETLLRANGFANIQPPVVVCNHEHRFIVAQQAQAVGVKPEKILLEPIGRNTAPAVATAALSLLEGAEDPLLLVLPSDHVIANTQAFYQAIESAIEVAEQGYLATFGVVPAAAETGYGYIQAGPEITKGARHVQRFVEKPSLEDAQRYLDSKEFTWNSGMFLFKASAYLGELSQHAPEILTHAQAALNAAAQDLDFLRLEEKAFARCPSISIDYAVMEKTAKAAVIPMQADWSDLGAWSAVWQVLNKDQNNNAMKGDAAFHNASNNLVHAQSRLVCVLGLNNVAVIETPDAVLVADKSSAQEVKQLVTLLESESRAEVLQHRKVARPWGAYDSIDEGERFKVKRITVDPGQGPSLQMHHHRAEHWVVVRGTARVRIGESEQIISENESVYIPIGQVHSLENPGKVPLELIEVQTGAYLAEDDIVRFEDRYGRAAAEPRLAAVQPSQKKVG